MVEDTELLIPAVAFWDNGHGQGGQMYLSSLGAVLKQASALGNQQMLSLCGSL